MPKITQGGEPTAAGQEEAQQRDLLDVLARLNRIGSAINRIRSGDPATLAATLQLIVDSAIEVVAGASAVLYLYDPYVQAFDATSRVSAGELSAPEPGDEPRPHGQGVRAVLERRRVLSYEEPDLAIHHIKARAGAQVVACLPLLVAEQPVGVLYVYLREPRAFTPLELLMLDNFVNQAATTIYHARQTAHLHQNLARMEDELVHLRRSGLLISSRLRLEETLEAILEMALEVTGAQYGIFRLLQPQGPDRQRYLITRAIASLGLDRPATEPLAVDDHSIMGWVAGHRQPLLIADLDDRPWSGLYYPLDRARPMRSELAVPLIGAGARLEGVLNLESPEPNAFGEQDSYLLQALAAQAVIAIQQARLLDALQEVAERLLTQPLQEVLDRLVMLACDLLDVPASAVWTREGPELVVRAATGAYARGARLPLEGSLAGQALLTGDVLAVNLLEHPDARLPGTLSGYTAALVVPLQGSPGQAAVGAFGVFSQDGAPETLTEADWDKKVLRILGHYAALAVENASRQEALRVAQEQRAVAETFAAMGDIAANLLHHLNNKVGTIPVRVEGIEDKCAAAVQANPYLAANLAAIERSAAEAMTAVRESLALLRPIEAALVQASTCVTLAVQAAHLPEQVTLETQGLERLPAVLAGQESLVLVILNLLQNAADAMGGRGRIVISGAAQAEFVELAVSDSGPGIAPELQDKIFEFNFSGRKAAGKLGFGLWWVKTLMARLGGSVTVESDGRRGTTFRLRLPRPEPYL